MTRITKRVAATKVINKMPIGKSFRLETLAKQARLTNHEMARFLHEYGEMKRTFVYIGCGTSLQRRVYRKKETT